MKILLPWLIVGAVLTIGLAGCTVAQQQFVAVDVATAQSVAVAAGDTTGAACWGSLGPAVAAIQAGKTVGLATVIEVARAAILATRGACAPLAQPVLQAIALLPGGGNALALAEASIR